MQGSHFWLRMTRLYTIWLQMYQRKDRLSHYQKLTSLSSFGSILKDFLETDVGKCEGRSFGRGRHDSIYNGYIHINGKVDYHITENRRASRRSVPF
jgi:hypothetical protein